MAAGGKVPVEAAALVLAGALVAARGGVEMAVFGSEEAAGGAGAAGSPVGRDRGGGS